LRALRIADIELTDDTYKKLLPMLDGLEKLYTFGDAMVSENIFRLLSSPVNEWGRWICPKLRKLNSSHSESGGIDIPAAAHISLLEARNPPAQWQLVPDTNAPARIEFLGIDWHEYDEEEIEVMEQYTEVDRISESKVIETPGMS